MASKRTQELEDALTRAAKDVSNYKKNAPKYDWEMNQNDKTAEEAINRLIKQAPAGSAERQALMEKKATWQRKYAAWQEKLAAYEDQFVKARAAYQASAKLDDKEKEQQDNKDTGVSNPKLDDEVNRLKQDVEAAPTKEDRTALKKPTPTKPVTPSKATGGTPNDTDGDGIPNLIDKDPNTPATPTTPTTPTTPASTTTKDGTVIASGQTDKTFWVSYLETTFKALDDPAQKKEIFSLINRANKFNMDEGAFLEELKGTKWWQSTYPSVAAFFIESNDPRKASAFAEKVGNAVQGVTRKLESLGVRLNDIDPVTGKLIDNSGVIKGIALKQLENNWDDNDLNEFLSTRSDVLFTGGGTIGSSFESIKRQASLYGVSIDKNFEKEINLSLLDGNDLRDANYWLNEMKQQAYDNPMYKAFAPAMKENNRTLYEVTNSYRKQMADLLEVDASNVTWKDLMDKAVDSTTGNARTFADFTKSVKKDPMWQYTKNAKETYSGMALDIAKMFGFVG